MITAGLEGFLQLPSLFWIDVSDTAMVLTDVGSSNGTFVRIGGRARLEPGDQLLIGMQLVRVES